MLVVIETDCIGSCKSNYHAITTTASSVSTYNNMIEIPSPEKKEKQQKTKQKENKGKKQTNNHTTESKTMNKWLN